MGTPLEHFSSHNALERLDDLGWTVSGHALHQKMNVIPIGANLQKANFVSLGDLQAYIPKRRVHLRVKDHTPIFGGADQMVEQDRDVVAFVDVGWLGHTLSVSYSYKSRSKLRGIKPNGIKEARFG